MTTSYFPTTEAARLAWVMNYRDKIAVHGPALGLSALEIANTQRKGFLSGQHQLHQTWA